MAEVKPPVVVNVTWESGLTFVARDAAHEWVLDGRNEGGPSPVVALGAALAGCMAIDLVHILTRGRFEVRALKADLIGERAETEPRRFVKVDLRFTIDTSAPDDQIARAIALSHDKYCSVWHSMRPDIALTTSFENRV
jgi:putative redox protein